MKKTIGSIVFGLIACATAFAVEESEVASLYFKTVGPDAYEDGARVLNGEFYALVWVKAGSTFAGFNADATLIDATNNKVVAMTRTSSAGCLNEKQKSLLKTELAGYYGGTMCVVLMDTRNADGTLAAPLGSQAAGYWPAAVNGYHAVSQMTVTDAILTTTLKIGSTIRVDTASAVPADAPQPVITGMTMREGANGREMVVRVKGTAAYLRYTVGGVDLGDGAGDASGATPANGAASAEDEIEIVVPATGDKGFFKVIRK